MKVNLKMADPDRRTGIQGDQIVDHTVTASELEPIVAPLGFQMLQFDAVADKMVWAYLIPARICR